MVIIIFSRSILKFGLMKRTLDSDVDEEIEDESFEFEDIKRRKHVTEETSLSWCEKYCPLRSSDVSVNPSKLKQLRQVMKDMIYRQLPKILIVSGPSGSGKSTSCKVLSKELSNGFVEYTETVKFEDFLNDGKYLVAKNLKFLIIEELPNVFHYETLNNFRNSLMEWVYLRQNLPPVIICLTELERTFNESQYDYFTIENNLNVNTLFPKSFLNDLRVQQIKFNPVSKKFMKSGIDRIYKAESKLFSRLPKPKLSQFLEFIYESGDIRSGINNLELWTRYYIKGFDLGSSLGYELDIQFCRNVSILLFHAIGKIIYSSSKYQNLDDNESNHKTIDDVLNNYDNFHLLNLSVLENYNNRIEDHDIKVVSEMAESLSASDLLYHLDEGKYYMARSTRYQLGEYKTPRNISPKINFTKNLSMIKMSNQIRKLILEVKDSIINTSFQNINLIDGFYMPMILSKKLNKNYERLGGKINVNLGDDMFDNDNEIGNEIKITDFIDNIYKNIGNNEEEEDGDMSDPIEDSDEEKVQNPFDTDYEFLDDAEFM